MTYRPASASLSGHAVSRARVSLPSWGLWHADVEIAGGADLSGAVVLSIADADYAGAIVSGGTWQGRSRYVVAGGAGGWGADLPARSYVNDAGVKASTVLADLARETGETIEDAPTTAIGPAWVRPAGPALAPMHLLYPSGWHVGADGVTRIGVRAAAEWTGALTVLSRDDAAGSMLIAPETVAGLEPGAVVDGLEAVDVEIEIEPGLLRARLWGAGPSGEGSRRIAALRRLLASLDPGSQFRGVWEYRAIVQTGERLHLQPARVSLGMPDLLAVRIRPGVPALASDVAAGAMVLVSFVDGDPARPVVVNFEDADGSAFRPDSLRIQAGSTGAYPTEHAASVEGMLVLLTAIFQFGIPAHPAPIVTLADLATNWTTLVNSALLLAPPLTIAPYSVGLAAAIAAKTPDPTGQTPGVAWPDVRGA